MPPGQDADADPAVDAIVADLRLLRERGLVRLRHADLAVLRALAARTRVAGAAGGGPGAVEAIVRAAVDNLGGGSLGAAAAATFGLGRGARDRAASDRRRQAAQCYGVSVERFRKHHERIVLEQVAEELLKLVMAPPASHGAAASPVPEIGGQIALDGRVAGQPVRLTVHVEPVELLAGVDVVVVPANVYLEPPQYFKSSVFAAVRRSAAIKGPDGQVVVDVVADELRSWLAKHGRTGLPVAPGTVVVTSSGDLAGQGIRRIYHVAITTPRVGTNDYDVEPAAIAAGVRNVLAMARSECRSFNPELRSIALPLLGAGRGGLDPATSFSWMWPALERHMTQDDPFDIHFVTHRKDVADVIVGALARARVIQAARQEPDR